MSSFKPNTTTSFALLCSSIVASSAWAQELTPMVVQGFNTGGAGQSATLANAYTIGAPDISNLPEGDTTNITDVLAQMPGVAIDQNQQIHIRNTEGPQFQYQINGVMVPFDINTNPPFISMINPMFIKQLSLLDGILPSRYSYATGGVVDIETKDGAEQPGGSVSFTFGQRDTLEPSAQYAGSVGKFSYYVSAQRSFKIPGLGELINRITILNLLDRTNLIRPAEGIGIFQSAYGPRFTIQDTISLLF